MSAATHINGKRVFGPPRPPNLLPRNYILKIDLCPGEIEDPAISLPRTSPKRWWTERLLRPSLFLQSAENALRISDDSGNDLIHRANMNATLGLETTPEKHALQTRLSELFEDRSFADATIEYEYDFGDRWDHCITIVGREDTGEVRNISTSGFICRDGEGHPCAEDVGGVDGWNELRDSYRAQSPTQDQIEKMDWFETSCSNMDPAGLGEGGDRIWDKDAVNRQLASL
ncbi:MAG: hypothetical protein M1819_000501 [Sarea resinae]|nr:MAG: hypothetical protein M1819_000501 [Sarea resinae]